MSIYCSISTIFYNLPLCHFFFSYASSHGPCIELIGFWNVFNASWLLFFLAFLKISSCCLYQIWHAIEIFPLNCLFFLLFFLFRSFNALSKSNLLMIVGQNYVVKLLVRPTHRTKEENFSWKSKCQKRIHSILQR